MLGLSAKCLVLLSVIGMVNSASANLILNGGFEETEVGNKQWKYFDSSKVDGWSGSNIEIWDSYGKVSAYEGQQHAELNAHGSKGQSFSIFQTIETEIGALYDVSFAYRARRNANEAFQVDLSSFDDAFFSVTVDDHQVNTWKTYKLSFEAIDLSTDLSFTSVTPSSGTVGNFLDDISVMKALKSLNAQTINVSVPSAAFFMVLGCAFLVRRKVISTIQQ